MNPLDNIKLAYIMLLTMPEGDHRRAMQPVMAQLRDHIADCAHRRPQAVQNCFESAVEMVRDV